MTLPLAQAYRDFKKGALTWEDYIHDMFRLVAGDPHEDDAWHERNEELRKVDLLGYSIFLWHKHLDFIKDTAPMEAVSLAYQTQSTEEVEKKLSILEDTQHSGMWQALAVLTLRERHADMLKMCLNHGFSYGELFEDAANLVKQDKSPKTYQVIAESDFRRKLPVRVMSAILV